MHLIAQLKSEIIVIGGGLAGSACAIHLARAGHAVTLIEKETAPHDKVCGEFLSHEAVTYIDALGIDLAAFGAVAIDRVCFEGRARKLPFVAKSLSRRILDEALLQQAQNAGVVVLRGRKAEEVYRHDSGWCVRLNTSPRGRGRASGGSAEEDRVRGFSSGMSPSPGRPRAVARPLPQGEVNTAAAVFLASGKHDLRGLKRAAGKQNDLVAFKMHWRLQPQPQRALAGMVELFLFPGGYGGLEPVENDNANLCFLIQRSMLDRLGDWDGALQHVLASSKPVAEKLADARPLWDRPLAITSIPYGYVRHDSDDGLWRLGDQAAVIPSFSGDGMAIALHSARLAAETYSAGGSAAQYQTKLARDVGRQVALATMVSRALVNPAGQRLCTFATRFMPHLMGSAAKATRIPEKALVA